MKIDNWSLFNTYPPERKYYYFINDKNDILLVYIITIVCRVVLCYKIISLYDHKTKNISYPNKLISTTTPNIICYKNIDIYNKHNTNENYTMNHYINNDIIRDIYNNTQNLIKLYSKIIKIKKVL